MEHESVNGTMAFKLTGLPKNIHRRELKALERMLYFPGELIPVKTGRTTYRKLTGFEEPVFFSGLLFFNKSVRSWYNTASMAVPVSQRIDDRDYVEQKGYFGRIISLLRITKYTFWSDTDRHITRYLEIIKKESHDKPLFVQRVFDLRCLWTEYLATETRPILLFRVPKDLKNSLGDVIDTIKVEPATPEFVQRHRESEAKRLMAETTNLKSETKIQEDTPKSFLPDSVTVSEFKCKR